MAGNEAFSGELEIMHIIAVPLLVRVCMHFIVNSFELARWQWKTGERMRHGRPKRTTEQAKSVIVAATVAYATSHHSLTIYLCAFTMTSI